MNRPPPVTFANLVSYLDLKSTDVPRITFNTEQTD